MPELPEVEAARRKVERHARGKTIQSVEALDDTSELEPRVLGRRQTNLK